MDNERRPASEDALAAVAAVVNTPTVRRKKNFFEKNMIPLKGDSRKAKRRKGIFDSCLVIIFICILVLAWVVVIDPWRAQRLQDELAGLTEPEVTTLAPPTEQGQTAPPVTVTGQPATQRMSAEQLKARNSHYIGWLRAPGAGINTAVVQTSDNDYYLTRDFDRKLSKYGNPFVDYRVSFDPMSANMVIYGHYMNNGTIFTYLSRYKQAATVQNNPLITLELADGTVNQYKIVAVLNINGKSQDDNGYVFAVNTPNFSSPESFNGYVRQIKERSFVNTGVDVQPGDKLISLQTCSYTYDYEFLYVVARLVRPGESAAVPASQIKANPSPRMPQAWYDKKKQENPFRNAEIWLP